MLVYNKLSIYIYLIIFAITHRIGNRKIRLKKFKEVIVSLFP